LFLLAADGDATCFDSSCVILRCTRILVPVLELCHQSMNPYCVCMNFYFWPSYYFAKAILIILCVLQGLFICGVGYSNFYVVYIYSSSWWYCYYCAVAVLCYQDSPDSENRSQLAVTPHPCYHYHSGTTKQHIYGYVAGNKSIRLIIQVINTLIAILILILTLTGILLMSSFKPDFKLYLNHI
jgi:hypothetical protein